MDPKDLVRRLDLEKKIAPWKFKVPRLKKGEIPLERVTGKKALDFFKNVQGYKSARIGPTIMFRGRKHYTIIVSIAEYFKIRDKILKSFGTKSRMNPMLGLNLKRSRKKQKIS